MSLELSRMDWSKQGGHMNLPNNWFVDQAKFDVEEPYIHIQPEFDSDDDKEYPQGKIVSIPKSLAYYLSVHFCGSETMRDTLIHQGRLEVRRKIKEALGIENE